MSQQSIEAYAFDPALSTAHLTDACMRLKVPFRLAPYGIKPVTAISGMICGPAIPVRHYGSVDVFLEALMDLPPDGILVIDNAARTDEACIGDLVVLEAKHAGAGAMVVNGLHRDTRELTQIGLPVFSYGAYPSGPARLDAREAEAFSSARFDDFSVNCGDTVFLDQDGVLFVESREVPQLVPVALKILETERSQARTAENGKSLREQFQFRLFMEQRDREPGYTFRKHLTGIAKAIEE